MAKITIKVWQPMTETTISRAIKSPEKTLEIEEINLKIQQKNDFLNLGVHIPAHTKLEVEKSILKLKLMKKNIISKLPRTTKEIEIPEVVLPSFEIDFDARRKGTAMSYIVGTVCRDVEKMFKYYERMDIKLFNSKAPVFMSFDFGGVQMCISGDTLNMDGANAQHVMDYKRKLQTSLKYGSTPKARAKFAKHVWASVEMIMTMDDNPCTINEYLDNCEIEQNKLEASKLQLELAENN